jgi:hypothetical protein
VADVGIALFLLVLVEEELREEGAGGCAVGVGVCMDVLVAAVGV